MEQHSQTWYQATDDGKKDHSRGEQERSLDLLKKGPGNYSATLGVLRDHQT